MRIVWINVRRVNIEKDFLTCTSTPTHITHKIFDQNYAAIHEIKPLLTLNQTIYVGSSVFRINQIADVLLPLQLYQKKHFDAEMLFADTNSLTNEIKSKDVYEEFFRLKQLFECTN